MRILFLTDNFPPEVNAPATRTYEHCREWVKKGASVTVITCQPNFPQGKVFPGYRNRLWQREEIDGIQVIRVWSYIAANSGFVKRILDFVSYAFMAFWAGLLVRTDIIIATSPQFFTAVSGCCLSIVKFRPWVMEVRDLWPESIKAVGAMKEDTFTYRFLEAIELWLYRRAKAIVVVTDAFKANLISRGVAEQKIAVIKNGVDLSKFSQREKDVDLVSQLGLEDRFVIGYIGTHGMAHALDFVLRTAAKVADSSLTFLLLGDGAEKQKLLQLKEELQLDNVIMLPFVKKEEVIRYISVLDVALVNLKKSDTFKTVIPSKIFENAALRKPILLGVEGESAEIIASYQAGLCFEPENEASFLAALAQLQNEPDLYQKLQAGCTQLATDFDRNKLAGRMYTYIDQLLS